MEAPSACTGSGGAVSLRREFVPNRQGTSRSLELLALGFLTPTQDPRRRGGVLARSSFPSPLRGGSGVGVKFGILPVPNGPYKRQHVLRGIRRQAGNRAQSPDYTGSFLLQLELIAEAGLGTDEPGYADIEIAGLELSVSGRRSVLWFGERLDDTVAAVDSRQFVRRRFCLLVGGSRSKRRCRAKDEAEAKQGTGPESRWHHTLQCSCLRKPWPAMLTI